MDTNTETKYNTAEAVAVAAVAVDNNNTNSINLSSYPTRLVSELQYLISSCCCCNVSELLFNRPHSILLSGIIGIGKSTLIQLIAIKYSITIYNITVLDCSTINKFQSKLTAIRRTINSNTNTNSTNNGCIILIDPITILLYNTDNNNNSNNNNNNSVLNNEYCNELKLFIDSLNNEDLLCIIGIYTNNYTNSNNNNNNDNNSTNTSILTELLSIFDHHYELSFTSNFDNNFNTSSSSVDYRLNQLKSHLLNIPYNTKSINLIELNQLLAGFTGADILLLVNTAITTAYTNRYNADSPASASIIELEKSDFDSALSIVHPSNIQANIDFIPANKNRITDNNNNTIIDNNWNSISGLSTVKQQLFESIIYPLLYRDDYQRFHITPSRGILLYGCPGTGKTYLARTIASNSNSNFINIPIAELLSSYYGDSEKQLARLFTIAKINQPSILFIDELQSLFIQRDGNNNTNNTSSTGKLLSQLCIEFDLLANNSDCAVLVLAATNTPQIIDTVLFRSGRLEQFIYCPLPDFNDRISIIQNCIKSTVNYNTNNNRINLIELSNNTVGFSPADIKSLCNSAGLQASIRINKFESINNIDNCDNYCLLQCDFNLALELVQSSVNPKLEEYLKNWKPKKQQK